MSSAVNPHLGGVAAGVDRSAIRPAQSLGKNISWISVGNGIRAGCQWGMIAALAKLGTPQIVGQYSLGLAITAPIFLLTGLQLNAIQATDAASEFSFSNYFTLRVLDAGVAWA